MTTYDGGSQATDSTETETGQTTSEQTPELPLSEFETNIQTTFEDISGLNEEKQRLQEIVVKSMEPGRNIRANTTVIHGYRNVGVKALGDALAHALEDDGFTVFRPTIDQDSLFREVPLPTCIKKVREAKPCVLRVDDIGFANLEAGTLTREVIDQLSADSPRVALVATTTYLDHPQQEFSMDFFSAWADISVEVNRPDGFRRRAILEDALEVQCADVNVTFDSAAVNIEDALTTISTGNLEVLRTVAKRAVIRADIDPETTALTSDHLKTAATTVAEEQNCSTDDTDDRVDQPEPDVMSVSVPDVSFDDVGGLHDVKERVRELLVYPTEYEDVFEQVGISPTHGLVLCGPPGTGKTLLAKAIATATDRTFIAVQGPELKSMWFGQTEQHIREIFSLADKHAPSVVFFDEFDALAGMRNNFTHEVNKSVVATLLAELDGIEDREDVLFLAATNRPDALDPAVIRSGRFGELLEVPLPDENGCREIFDIYAADLPTAESVTPSWFTDQLPEGISGADIERVCERSLYEALGDVNVEDDEVVIGREHLRAAITAITRSETTDSTDTQPKAFE